MLGDSEPNNREHLAALLRELPSMERMAFKGHPGWVALCQLYGPMVCRPATWPGYCRDVKQWAAAHCRETLPPKPDNAHDALADAQWCRDAWDHVRLGNMRASSDDAPRQVGRL